MVDCGPVAPVQPWEVWNAGEWAEFFDREECPHAAALWRTFADLATAVPFPVERFAVESLIGKEWR